MAILLEFSNDGPVGIVSGHEEWREENTLEIWFLLGGSMELTDDSRMVPTFLT